MRFPSELLCQCWFLAGPTACGKSDVAISLAEQLPSVASVGVEIVSLDSMTLYRRMNIGTAKPSAEIRQKFPHHLFDILEPWQDFSVAEYLNAAAAVCREIVDRGRIPLFVGGTGLYLRSLLRGVFEGPPANEVIRQRLTSEAMHDSVGTLHDRLQQLDPDAASRLHPNDLRRIIRALEVIELTGQTLSEQHREEPLPPDQQPEHVFWLSPPRDWLHQRINDRVHAMLAAGWINEVRDLLNEPQSLSHTAAQALGYQELIAHVRGETKLSDAIERIQTRTRQFAKRQHTWFRNLVECREIPISGDETPREIAERITDRPSPLAGHPATDSSRSR